MKITTVTYSRTYPTGLYANEKIGVEATIDETDNVDQVFDMLKGICDGQHKSNNPQLYTETPIHNNSQWEVANNTQEPLPKRTKEEVLLHEIEIATSIASLNQWKLLISNSKQEIKDAYEKKLLELSK